jgi:hypothetical protein
MKPACVFAVAVILVLATAEVAVAQDAGAFGGEWRARNQANSAIMGANIYKDAGRWMVQFLGKCTPNPCVWNPEPLVVLETPQSGGAPRGLATFQRSNMRRVMTIRLGEDSLVVEVYSMAAPVPSRGFAGRNTFTIDELTRTKATAARLPSGPSGRPR